MTHDLIVELGDRHYRVERPFGSWPQNTGFVTDVTVDARGHVFVMLRHDPLVHPADPRVIELDPEGRHIAGWGGNDIADSHMLTATSSGHLIAVDRDMHEIIWFTPDGRRVGQLGQRGRPNSPFNHPTDVSIAPWGDIYVSDGYGAALVHRFAPDGRHLQSWGGQGSEDGQFVWPHSIWTFADGRVVVIDRTWNRVQVFDGEGQHLETWYDFYQPVGIWGDAEGNAYITDMVPSLTKIAPDGTRIGRCRPMLNGAHGLYGTPTGDILLAEGNPSRITRLKLLG